METQSVSPRLMSRLFLVAVLSVAGLSSGCMGFKIVRDDTPTPATASKDDSGVKQAGYNPVDPKIDLPQPKPAPAVANVAPAQPGEAARLTAAFNNKVIYAPDPTRGGDPVPGILGRLYVFSTDEAVPIIAEGSLIVDLWDNSPNINGGKPKLLEVWNIDAESFAKFRKRDIIGEGYSLFLPWSTYNVDIKQVNMIVRYVGKDGRVLISPPEQLAIDHATTLQRAAEKVGVSPSGIK